MICRLLRIFQQLEEIALIVCFTGMVGVALAQILLRNVFADGLVWADALVQVLVLWVSLLGAMVATRRRDHIRIDLLMRFVPMGYQTLLARLLFALSAVVCAVVVWYAVALIQLEQDAPQIVFMNVPAWVCQLVIPFAFGVMALRFGCFALRGATLHDAASWGEGHH